MNNLIVIGHPDKNSFCYNGIMKTIKGELDHAKQNVEVIDLYKDDLSLSKWTSAYGSTPKKKEVIKHYQELVTWADRIYFISPVWWFRCTPLLEEFFDVVFTPKFAYQFVPLLPKYGYPKPLLSNKKVRTYLTHGAPALPVYFLYLNAVKLRLSLGVYSFVFGWFKAKTRQFWSVPFCTDAERQTMLDKVRKDVRNDITHT
jgi:putative NADPH-quinone reductase